MFNRGGNWPRPHWVFGSNSWARSDPEPEPDPKYGRQPNVVFNGYTRGIAPTWMDGVLI